MSGFRDLEGSGSKSSCSNIGLATLHLGPAVAQVKSLQSARRV